MKSLFIAVLIFCFCGCKKKSSTTPEDPAYIQFSAKALEYVQLPVNAYFIYKDSASGLLDSVVVTQSELKKELQPEQNSTTEFGTSTLPAYYYQSFSLLLTNYSGAPQKDWFYGTGESVFLKNFTYYKNSDSAALSLSEIDRITGTWISWVFFYPLDTSSSANEYLLVIPSIVIEGKVYSNVELHFYTNGIDSTDPNYVRSIYYWAKGVGIIKREIKTSNSIKTYLLIRNG